MKILIAEDDPITRKGIQVFLSREGHEISEADDGESALHKTLSSAYDVILTDMMMPGLTGLELLKQLQKNQCRIPVMIMTAYANVEDAVEALKLGAVDYLTKPLNLDELHHKIQRIEKNQAMQIENFQLKERIRSFEMPEMIGDSRPMHTLRTKLQRISQDADVSVMILGESGTGKELVARTLHNLSIRKNKPFIAVNCAAFQDSLMESELFGHCKGAFTGAYRDKEGIFKLADRGTLFLDEISEMSAAMQAKLLRVLQEQIIQPVGGSKTIHVDVRVLCASNQDLKLLVENHLFREDLYYRLNVIEIHMPPLRDRIDDIPLLAEHFITRYRSPQSMNFQFRPNAMRRLQRYAWPGNIRELENLIRMLISTIHHEDITCEDLPEKFQYSVDQPENNMHSMENPDFKSALQQVTDRFEKSYLSHHLEKYQGNISLTAEFIGLSRASLHQKIKKYKL